MEFNYKLNETNNERGRGLQNPQQDFRIEQHQPSANQQQLLSTLQFINLELKIGIN